MSTAIAEKFSVKNLDCANCAAKIEKGLKSVEGFHDVVLDFANLTLHVKTDDTALVIEEVKKIEPDVTLTLRSPMSAGQTADSDSEEFEFKREGFFLGVAGILFLVQLSSEYFFQSELYARFEIPLVIIAYLLAGWNVLLGSFRTLRRGMLFDENVLMVIATVGAIAIQAYSEAIGVMIFYKIGELLQELAVSKSRRSIRGLLAIRPDKASVKTNNGYQDLAPESVNIGDEILVKPGEKIPLDGEIISGQSQLDTSALTGESVPVMVRVGDGVMAGQINGSGSLEIRVTRLFTESSIAKVMDLVENATARKAKTEKFITVFARYYTPAVVAVAASIAFIPPLVTGDPFQTWIYRALVLLVISCPCALVISIPLGYFGGIGRASRQGILVKGSNFIDALAGVKTVVFDKTGTLTKGIFEVKEVVSHNGVTKEELLEFAAAAESQSTHPIADSIKKAYQQTGSDLDPTLIRDHTEFAGMGVTATYGEHSIMVGNDSFMHQNNVDHPLCDFDDTVVQVVVDGTFAGYITIGDEKKPEAWDAIVQLRAQGIEHISMLTGDNENAAAVVARELQLDSFYAGLLPEDKVAVFEKLNEQYAADGKIAFVGDGINDAPVIARADVGVAMGALGSDAAIETADVVLMKDSPVKVAEAVSISRQTRRIVWQNIIMALSIKGIFIVFGVMGMASMWEAVFADMGTALLAVANSTRIIGHKLSN
jgi:Zn2+/Cd2+-exporting ATPase